MKIYKCKYCNFTTMVGNMSSGLKSAKQRMGQHYHRSHRSLLPSNMSGYQWFYYTLTGKDRGSCVQCGNETDFNENTMKYSRYCKNPICKENYREVFKNRMMKVHGKIHLLNDPEHQKKMQQGRRIFRYYRWSDGTRFGCLSSYEVHFLQMLDKRLKWPSTDIVWPSPHTYEYKYKGKSHFYMPDGFIPSMSLEIEIKDDGSAKNINADSRAKDVLKDTLMKSIENLFDYIKIVNRDYREFLKIIRQDD